MQSVYELGDGDQDDVGAVGVDEADEWLQVPSGLVVDGVVLQCALRVLTAWRQLRDIDEVLWEHITPQTTAGSGPRRT